MPLPRTRGDELTATVSSTVTVRTASVILRTFDTLTNPCNYLADQLTDRILAEISAPPDSDLECDFISVSMMSDARREYRWTVQVSWTV